MLLRIRELTAGKFSYFIVAIITVPLALWGISYYFQGVFDPVVIEVESVEVTLSEFNQEFNQRKRSVASQMNDSQRMPEDAKIKQTVISSFLREGLIAHDADKYHYRIPDSVLAEEILQMSEFWVDNQFDRKLYADALQARRLSQSRFEEQIRERLRRSKLGSVIEESSFTLPYEEDAYEEFLFEERQGRYIALPINDYIGSDDIPLSRIEIYYVENEEDFMTSDRFSFEYIELNVEEIAAGLNLDAGEVRSYYDENIALFSVAQQRKLAHILIDFEHRSEEVAQERADEVYEKLQQGEDFSELAKIYSDDEFTVEAGGELPPLAREDLDDEIADVVFALNAGEFSAPVKSSFGLQIFKLIGVEPMISKPFAEVREGIDTLLKREQAEDIYGDAIEELKFLVYEHSDSLKEVADQIGAVAVKVANQLDVKKEEGPLQYPQVRQAVYTDQVLKFGESSELIKVAKEHAFVVKLSENGYKAGRQRSLEEVEDEVIKSIREEDAWKSAGAAVDDMMKRLKAKETTLDELSQELSSQIKQIDFIRRDDQQVYPGLVRSLFMIARDSGKHSLGLESDSAYALIELVKARLGEFLPLDKPDLNRGMEEYRVVLRMILGNTKVDIDTEALADD